MRDENNIKVELPSGFVMNLEKRNNRGTYKFQLGMLEFISDGKPVVQGTECPVNIKLVDPAELVTSILSPNPSANCCRYTL